MDKVDNTREYSAGSVNFQSGGSNINYSYTPSVDSKSASTTAYEYCFGSTMNTTMAVTLKSIDSTGVDLKYAYSATKLDKSSNFTGESNYTPQILKNRGDKVYIYILVTPTDESIPTTFTSSVKFWYGQPTIITYNINGEDISEVVVKGQELSEPTLPVLDNGYSCIGWYSNAEYTQMVDFETSSRKENLYARYPNLPEDYLAFDATKQCYYIKRGTSELPSNLALPSTYKGYNVTYIAEVTDAKNGAFYNKYLTRVTIGKNITSIGAYSFMECRQLTSLTILGDVDTIGTWAFMNCYAMAEIYNLSKDLNITLGSSSSNGYINIGAEVIHTDIADLTKIVTVDNILYYVMDNGLYKGLAPATYIEDTTHIKFDKRLYRFAFAPFIDWRNIVSVDFSECINFTSFGGYDFKGCYNLTSIDLSECKSLTSIGLTAFSGCTSLQKINFPAKLQTIDYNAFENCTSLTSVTLPKNLQTIGDYAFSGCTSLKSVNLQDCTSLTSIGAYAFYSCNLLTVDFSECINLVGLGGYAFQNCYNLQSIDLSNTKISYIGSCEFYNCQNLTSVKLSKNLQTIGYNSFENCTSLTNVDMSKYTHLTTISPSAFLGCTALESIDLSKCDKLTIIDSSAFQNCTKLQDIKLPSSVESIHSYAFANCKSLQSIQLPSSLKYIYEYAFYQNGLSSIVIPKSAISIDETSFMSCTALESVVVESGNTVYDSRDNCNAIIETANNKVIIGCKNTVIPNTVRSIGPDAFHYCTGLISIISPSTITSIADTSFIYCYNLATVYNLSSLNIVAGNTDNGYVGAYATNVYTSLDD